MNHAYTDEVKNTNWVERLEGEGKDCFSEIRVEGRDIFDVLSAEGVDMFYTREYEHALCLMTADGLNEHVSIPHPSGIAITDSVVYVVSTRSPHFLVEWRFCQVSGKEDELILLPTRSTYMPGILYAHEIVAKEGKVYINATGLNEIIEIDPEKIYDHKVAYRPSILSAETSKNCMQLNSLCFSNQDGYSTCFNFADESYKPWKGKGSPDKLGGVIRHSDSKVLVDGLTCPHSVRCVGGKLYYCNSGYGELRVVSVDGSEDECVIRLPGFTRGLAISKNYFFVGLSKVQDEKQNYAPGVEAGESICGIVVIDRATRRLVSTVMFESGYQIFDIQLRDKCASSIRLPRSRQAGSIVPSNDFYKWEVA